MSVDARGEQLPEKRAAYEPAARLAEPTPHDPAMKRPISTVTGAVLVLLRVVTGVAVLITVMAGGTPDDSLADLVGVQADDETAAIGLGVYASVVGVSLLIQAILGLLILAGRNGPRVWVMLFAVASISTAFAGWWWQGQEIRVSGTLLSVALDVLILLALSSRSASAYARRNEPRPD
ncbi:hypothetical protein ABC304_05360 [Microbacterium sp. 1P10UB]|uniref:hypothetical protein n=1 Tax=unclassified Microbacterium TaxID=2609290 RepID=UPI0039A0BB3B